MDLDGLEEINHSFGPALGDQLVVAVAARLAEVIGPDDQAVPRYGGDQFDPVLPGRVHRPVGRAHRPVRCSRSVQTPFDVGESTVAVSANIGMAITEERCSRPDEVLRDADAALHQAKAAGRGTYAMFRPGHARPRSPPSTAERRLRRALDNGELRLYYQPIVSLWTQRLIGVEALLRWNDPNAGLINPDEFMGALEDTGLIVPIGAWVVEEVARQCRTWNDTFPDRPTLTVKINVSERQLGQANFVSLVRDAVDHSGVDPSLDLPRDRRERAHARPGGHLRDRWPSCGVWGSTWPSTGSAPATPRSSTSGASSWPCSPSTGPSWTAWWAPTRTPPSSST